MTSLKPLLLLVTVLTAFSGVAKASPAPESQGQHVVRPGDTLEGITAHKARHDRAQDPPRPRGRVPRADAARLDRR